MMEVAMSADCATNPYLARPSLRSIVQRLASGFRGPDSRFRLANQIDALDERMLRDIGITRSEAAREARRLRQL
jgi:uncharacterized protein YjiS (DUF1127 family)